MVVSETTDVRSRRLGEGMTLRDLADRCTDEGAPVSYSQLAKIERGEYAPRPQLRAVLTKVLKLDADHFDRSVA